jgi:hypothetical protein
MKKPDLADDFEVSTKDPLAAEHADVIAWVEAAVKKLGDLNWYGDVDLKQVPAGQKFSNIRFLRRPNNHALMAAFQKIIRFSKHPNRDHQTSELSCWDSQSPIWSEW